MNGKGNEHEHICKIVFNLSQFILEAGSETFERTSRYYSEVHCLGSSA